MAGVQVSDVINFGRIAWDIYHFGWKEEFNARQVAGGDFPAICSVCHATRQYLEFGNDVRSLASNLDILSRVVIHAVQSLRQQSPHWAPRLRWDERSLLDIIGDYRATIRECEGLINTNKRYSLPSGPVRNLEWNVLVQPQADRLRQRIQLHNSKILHVLKPFEIDLLCRVRQDIERMHHDLAERITAVHHDIRRLIGILTPDLEAALEQQAHREIHFLDVPVPVAERFRQQSLADRPEYGYDVEPSLGDLTDAFIMHFGTSTVVFRSGMLLETRLPPAEQYLSLLKCVWLAGKFRCCRALREASPESHWPSYVRQLEDELSAQCARFGGELMVPNVNAGMPPVAYNIWPEKEKTQLVDVVTRSETVEQILEVPLAVYGPVKRKIKLFRRLDSNDSRFRITIYGAEDTVMGKPRTKETTIDFDLKSVILNPQYASSPCYSLSVGIEMVYDMILRKDEREAPLKFVSLEDVLNFQNAITGFQTWNFFSQHHVKVSFVIQGREDAVEELCSVQLWVPYRMDGELVNETTATDVSITVEMQSRSASVACMGPHSAATIAPQRSGTENLLLSPTAVSHSASLDRSPILDRYHPSMSTGQPGHGGMVSSLQFPPVLPGHMVQSPRTSHYHVSSRDSVPSPTNLHAQYHPSSSPLSPSHSGNGSPNSHLTYSPWPTPTLSSSPTLGDGRHNRSLSTSSNISTVAPGGSSSSGGNRTITTVPVGRSTGLMYREPPKPLLVLFNYASQTGHPSIVTIELDEDTGHNPERCDCRRSRPAGARCTMAALECQNGKRALQARRFDSVRKAGGDANWNVARLAMNRRNEKDYASALWKGVCRVTLDFPSPDARAMVVGTPSECKCKTKTQGDITRCLRMGHKGMLGEVKEYYRRECIEYHKAKKLNRKDVVNGVRED